MRIREAAVKKRKMILGGVGGREGPQHNTTQHMAMEPETHAHVSSKRVIRISAIISQLRTIGFCGGRIFVPSVLCAFVGCLVRALNTL